MSKPIFTRSAFIEFLETKNPNEEYPYGDADRCACAEYANSLGMTWSEAKLQSVEFEVLDGYAANADPRTFGGLLYGLKNVSEEKYQTKIKSYKEVRELTKYAIDY